jgi:hypothetical protein
MIRLGEKLVLTKSVNDLLFKGYNDTLLLIAQKMKATKLPYTKFGWFYGVSNEIEQLTIRFEIIPKNFHMNNLLLFLVEK